MASRGVANGVNGGLIRFRNRHCNVCGSKAIVRISESSKNPGKLYFFCENERCGYFEFWMPGRDEFYLPICFVGEDLVEAVKGLSEEVKNWKSRKTMNWVVIGVVLLFLWIKCNK